MGKFTGIKCPKCGKKGLHHPIMKNKTLLVIAPGKGVQRGAVFSILVAETGEHLASHFCSHAVFAYGDLYAHRPERIEEWAKRFGELEVKYIDETSISEEQLLERNKKWYAELPKERKAQFLHSRRKPSGR